MVANIFTQFPYYKTTSYGSAVIWQITQPIEHLPTESQR